MKVKRYRAKTAHEAMAQIKKELGKDAVILKTTAVPKRGLLSCMKTEEVEVVAAVEYSGQKSPGTHREIKINAPKKKKTTAQSQKKEVKKVQWPKYNPLGVEEGIKTVKEEHTSVLKKGLTVNDNVIPESDSWQSEELNRRLVSHRNEVLSLVGDYESRLWADSRDTLPVPLAQERSNLRRNGVHPKLTTKILREAVGSIGRDEPLTNGRLRERIIFQMANLIKIGGPLQCRSNAPKVVALVGPTGVGKTTTLAKLAVNGKFHFKKRVALISADTYRMAALEQLGAFAGVAQLPLSAVYSPEEFRAAVQSMRDCDLILIDTAGKGQRDEEHIAGLRDYFRQVEDMEIHLVLPANMKSIDLLSVVGRYHSALPIDRIIITKVDETRTLGSLLNVFNKIKNPLSYITTGQSVPEDIELANAQKIAKMMLRC